MTLKPILFANIIDLYQTFTLQNDQLSPNDLQTKLIENYSNMIKEVDGISNKEMIIEWLKSLPLSTYKNIQSHIEKLLDFGIDSTTTIECKDCGQSVILDVPLNPIGFFM